MYESSVSIAAPPQVLLPLPNGVKETLAALAQARREVHLAQAREAELVAHYAVLCADLSEAEVVDEPALPGAERRVNLTGEGCPWVPEFASFELAVALGESDGGAVGYMWAALNCRFRFPRVWDLVQAGAVPFWKATKAVGPCVNLGLEACREIEDVIVARLESMPLSRLVKKVEGLALAHRTAEERAAALEASRESRGVWVEDAPAGYARISAFVSAGGAVALDSQVRRLAQVLKEGGDTSTLQARRARALEILANPAHALSLLQASILDELPQLADGNGCPDVGVPGHYCGRVEVEPEKLLPKAQLVVHLTDATLRDQSGPVRAEGLRPLLAEWTAEFLGHHRVHVRPLIDLPGMAPADSYEIPERMREGVVFRSPFSVFPFSRRRARGSTTEDLGRGMGLHQVAAATAATDGHPYDCDLDHTIPWSPRQRGRTEPANLGPLSRKEHRAKTHAGWEAVQIFPGVFLWRSPLGQIAVTTPSGSWQLHLPAPAQAVALAA